MKFFNKVIENFQTTKFSKEYIKVGSTRKEIEEQVESRLFLKIKDCIGNIVKTCINQFIPYPGSA